MKNLLLILFVFCGLNLFSQEIKYSDLSSGKRFKGEFKTYVSKDGAIYKSGDKIKIGLPSSNKEFAFVYETHLGLIGAPLTAIGSGTEAEILYFKVAGYNVSDYRVLAACKLRSTGGYSIQLENAIVSGEIKSFGMTSDEALSALKKAKDKLELGLITQAKYDSLKIELSKLIK
jgi:hypothetical protein